MNFKPMNRKSASAGDPVLLAFTILALLAHPMAAESPDAHINFQSEWGVPLEAVVYEFRTRDR